MMSLEDLAGYHNTDKLWHGYIPHYARHFYGMVNWPVSLLEIGVASGASMKMWNDHFRHPKAQFVGIDIDPDCYIEIGDRVEIVITDSNDYRPDREFDIIIDDGSHVAKDIVKAFINLWANVSPDGWYVIEDWKVQLRGDYGGGPSGSPATEEVKNIFQSILVGDETSVSELHAYEEILFLRKKP